MVEKKLKIKKVLLLGSGALKIGEAGEFDYSGSQAAKAMREEGITVVLINPNIATIQTSKELVDTIYFLPVNPYFVEKVIAKEKPDGILLGFGGQTALNCGLTLWKNKVFEKYGVKVLGTPVSSIEKTEDRLLFRDYIKRLGFKVPESSVGKNLQELEQIANRVNYPVIVRAGFSLGGLGSGVARSKKELLDIGVKALIGSEQILIEEYLDHWKEIEYEIVRDSYDNAITVCNMENFDPMGIHTGESIVVAPSQTLTNSQYHQLREIAIIIIKSLPVVGECNIQYALNPKNGDYRIIEINARLSRSSALASKATGYPLAYIAAKLALGYSLAEISNQVTKVTSAFFEPALDYVVVKIPRWDFLKFKDMEERIGSEMQSVGEVMAIGRTFEESFQKAIRSLDIDYEGVLPDELDPASLENNKKNTIIYKSLIPSPSRPYNIAYNLFYGQTVEEIYEQTGIDTWFLESVGKIVEFYKRMIENSKRHKLEKQILRDAKLLGFSDQQIAEIYNLKCQHVRLLRKKYAIIPYVCQVDTLAGEFPAKTNYLYFSYHRQQSDIECGDSKKKVAIIGGGSYQIGSSVEFDWCAVNCVLTARKLGYTTIMINCNPETVSTDYDISDKLYFEELSLERILDIVDFEKCPLIVSVGGQIPNNRAPKLAREQVKILGSQPAIIDQVENRQKFSALLDTLEIKQPIWKRLTKKVQALKFARNIGFPVLMRPSYVLSGRAMFVAYSEKTFESYIGQGSSVINPEYPIVISKFIRGSIEVDFDSVAAEGQIIVQAISEHVEHAGVHSGDATLVLPPFSLSHTSIEKITKIAKKIIKTLKLNGPINIQFLVNQSGKFDPDVLVIEANLRASRSFPFVSKVLKTNFIELATKIMLGMKVKPVKLKTPKYFGVKAPHFSFTRLRQADPVLRVEMASTGEVACFGDDLYEAYLKALLSTGMPLARHCALLSLGGMEGKERLLPVVYLLKDMKFKLYATRQTALFLGKHKIHCEFVYKVHENGRPHVVDLIKDRKVDLVINLSDRSDLGVKELLKEVTDGYLIRRAAVDANIPLFTKATIANLYVTALHKYTPDSLKVKSWDEYVIK